MLRNENGIQYDGRSQGRYHGYRDAPHNVKLHNLQRQGRDEEGEGGGEGALRHEAEQNEEEHYRAPKCSLKGKV